MYQFRKKPVVVEAFQFTRRNNGAVPHPEWFEDAVTRNDVILRNTRKWGDMTLPAYCEIKTLEGIHRCDENDWVIRGVKGELYPCKPDIFALTYESALASQQSASAQAVAWGIFAEYNGVRSLRDTHPNKEDAENQARCFAPERNAKVVTFYTAPPAPQVSQPVLSDRECFDIFFRCEQHMEKWLHDHHGSTPLQSSAECMRYILKAAGGSQNG